MRADVNFIKLFSSVTDVAKNKLGCLFLESFLHASLIVASKVSQSLALNVSNF